MEHTMRLWRTQIYTMWSGIFILLMLYLKKYKRK